MAAPTRSERPYLPLNEWIKLMTVISNDGKKLVTHFSQVPPHLQEMFKNACLRVAFQLKEFNKEGKLAFREIVVKNKPSLLFNFDKQFQGFVFKSSL